MHRLIKAELYKLFRLRTFKVLCIISLLLAFVVVGMTILFSSEEFIRGTLKDMPPEMQDQFMEQIMGVSGENAPAFRPGNIGHNIQSQDMFNPTAKEIFHGSFGSGIIEILLVVLMAALVAGEYSSGTIKNILAYGKKREHYYASKLIAGSIALAIMTAIMVSIATVISAFMYGWGEPFTISEAFHILKVYSAAMIVGISILSLVTLLATLLKNNGITIGIGITVFTLLPVFTSLLYGRYDWFDTLFKSTVTYNWAIVTSIRSTGGDIIQALLVAVILTLVSAAAGIMVFKKQDIT